MAVSKAAINPASFSFLGSLPHHSPLLSLLSQCLLPTLARMKAKHSAEAAAAAAASSGRVACVIYIIIISLWQRHALLLALSLSLALSLASSSKLQIESNFHTYYRHVYGGGREGIRQRAGEWNTRSVAHLLTALLCFAGCV